MVDIVSIHLIRCVLRVINIPSGNLEKVDEDLNSIVRSIASRLLHHHVSKVEEAD